MTPEQYSAAWTRRPSNAVARLGQRQLMVLSAHDLVQAARAEGTLLVALIGPAPAALLGFARADRVAAEVDAGFTGLAVSAAPGEVDRSLSDAGKAVAALELGLEVVPSAGSPEDAAAMVTSLRSRGARPSAVRLTGFERRAREMA